MINSFFNLIIIKFELVIKKLKKIFINNLRKKLINIL